ncbi:protein prenyltransferase alpha subunit repeat containing protein 1 [Schistosoma japonicum]|nr:protein prenyltransferase alpha subunit repeat containing protein 1 [Schistosoma japonicum]
MFGKYEMELISNDLLNCLLLIAPNTTTFWSYKCQSLQNNKLSTSCEIKIHSCIVQNYSYFNDDTFVQHELELCNKFADKYRCNYCLWQYRRFLLMHLHKREMMNNRFMASIESTPTTVQLYR